jgi:hypothetical protein
LSNTYFETLNWFHVTKLWFCHKISCFSNGFFFGSKIKLSLINHHYYLQCEKVLERVFLHILNIVKFG